MAEACKRCTKCGEEKLATREFFYGAKNVKDGLHSHCKDCFKHDRRERYAADPEAAREIARRCQERNPEEARAQQRARYHDRMANDPEWRAKERERQKEKNRLERLKHPDRLKDRAARYRARNYERVTAAQRERKRLEYLSDPEKFKARSAKQRAERLEISGEFTPLDVNAAFRKQNGCCLYCGAKIKWRETQWEIDHFIPVSRGGTNDPSNIVVACMPCNRSKHDKMPWEWRPDLFTSPQAQQ